MAGAEVVRQVVFALPGQTVEFADRQAGQATVLRVEIRGAQPFFASYEVAWWVGGERNTAWVESHEVRAVPGETLAGRCLGFGG